MLTILWNQWRVSSDSSGTGHTLDWQANARLAYRVREEQLQHLENDQKDMLELVSIITSTIL